MAKRTDKTANQVNDNIFQEITDKFLSCLDQGSIPWQEGWNRTDTGFIKSDGQSYSFLNSLLLALQGCTPGEFVTLAEIERRTGKSKEDGSVWALFNKVDGKIPPTHRVYFYGRYRLKDENGKPKVDEKGEPLFARSHFLRAAYVWQVGKDVNCPLKFEKKREQKIINPIHEMESLKLQYQAREHIEIKVMNATPAYNPTEDFIHMPEINLYKSSEAYYCDLFHEIAHSTGHEKRLKRDITKRDRESYSLEELVAEITSTCILHDKGIATKATDKNSMAYVQGWAKALRSDPTMVEKACKLAIKATNFIYNGKKNND